MYFDNEERCADLTNGFVFKGRQVVSEQDICELASRKTGEKKYKARKKLYRQRYRDFERKKVFGVNCVMISIENQENVHYAM